MLSDNLKLQNIFILAGSYFFYSWWDWRFLTLLAGSSLINYLLGLVISRTTSVRNRKVFLYSGILLDLGALAFFKYYNFFVTAFIDSFSGMGLTLNWHTLKLILPLGISFYTFRMISYLLDIDKGKIQPATDVVIFFSYVSFFPSLISGPIDKAKLLIPQLEKKRVFDNRVMTDGMRQLLWGLFKKIVVADNCAEISNQIFGNYQNLPASSLFLGALFYTLQLYADFSGYSDMAIGFAKLLGFRITRNFNYPFFAQNIAEYWRRWHISLTAWLTEYVFTPLSIKFRDLGKTGLALAIIINFTICGIWHGANWTYVLFGLLHGCYFIPLIIRGTMNSKNRKIKNSLVPSFPEAGRMAGTFILVMLTNILFRADSISHASDYFSHLFSASVFSYPLFTNRISALTSLVFSVIMLACEWIQRDKEHALQLEGIRMPATIRWGMYYLIGIIIIWFGGNQDTFIYFQF
jgi:D-alanyl-lipoteichoic acid acyltransferase DltB (MBOAT superfamily)